MHVTEYDRLILKYKWTNNFLNESTGISECYRNNFEIDGQVQLEVYIDNDGGIQNKMKFS